MKKFLLIVGLILTQQVLSQIPTNGLSVHFPFNGNVNDTSGNNYHATVANPTYAADRNGNASKAIQTGDLGSYALQHDYSAHVADFKTQSFSYGCWVKLDYFIPNQLPIVMNNGAVNDNFFRFSSDGTDAILQTGYRVNDPFSVQYRTLTVIDLQDYFLEWTHYMVTSDYDAANDTRIVKLFVNGQLHQTASYTFSESQILYNSTVNALGIGTNLNGAIDDFVYYTRAISADEVFAIYGECFTAEQIGSIELNGNVLALDGSTINADYQWVDCDDANAPISGATSPTFSPLASGNYAVVLTKNTCSYTSPCISYCVPLTTTVSLSGNTLTSLQNGTSYQWFDCDNGNAPISGATSQTFTPTVSGNYAVQVGDGSCSDLSDCQSVTISTAGLNNINGNQIQLFPNPANDFIQLTGLEAGNDIRILSLNGSVVAVIHAQSSESSISLSELENGVYFIHIYAGDKFVTAKKLSVIR